jgi:CDP-4-dehydro-6-deoxyglucose reductase, E1
MKKIEYSCKVRGFMEYWNLLQAVFRYDLTEAGKFTAQFEKEFSDFIGVKYSSFVNSGSTANFMAVMALTQPELTHRINKGDEVITTACGFPTTVAPIVQCGAVPVFIDVNPETYNADVKTIKKAITKRTKAVILAHTLGNPFDMKGIRKLCDKYGLYLIEDNCDALGSEYQGLRTGSIGDISTCSFYPAHQITTGEGGMVSTNNDELYKILNSLKNWGRDCICPPRKDNVCGMRFDRFIGGIPYDHKYIYSRFGYNFKATDFQAAIGAAQIKRIEWIAKKRNENWERLYNCIHDYPEHTFFKYQKRKGFTSSWAFILTCKKGHRHEIMQYLESKRIQCRLLFAGNITKQPMFNKIKYRISGDLKNTDNIMQNTLFVGCHPYLTDEQIRHMAWHITNAYHAY